MLAVIENNKMERKLIAARLTFFRIEAIYLCVEEALKRPASLTNANGVLVAMKPMAPPPVWSQIEAVADRGAARRVCPPGLLDRGLNLLY